MRESVNFLLSSELPADLWHLEIDWADGSRSEALVGSELVSVLSVVVEGEGEWGGSVDAELEASSVGCDELPSLSRPEVEFADSSLCGVPEPVVVRNERLVKCALCAGFSVRLNVFGSVCCELPDSDANSCDPGVGSSSSSCIVLEKVLIQLEGIVSSPFCDDGVRDEVLRDHGVCVTDDGECKDCN